jgi:nucleoside-diphosphate-sugar epimerase
MKVLITGHNGYVGSVMARLVQADGHEVVGLDTYFFEDCTFGPPQSDVLALRLDIRDVQPAHLDGFDAIVHLAALCNDPLGDLDPATTYEINHQASVRLARAAKGAGVPRFLFASSCSLYGVAGDGMVDEEATFNPITPYGRSKVLVEHDVRLLADAAFTPTFLRSATAYGVSPRLRADVVVNNLVGAAYTTGEIVLQSDGTPWRPLVHVEDFCRAFIAVLHAPRPLVHNAAFNVGRTEENYRVRDLAELVRQAMPGSRVRYVSGAGPDPRSYRVDCSKIAATLPEYRPQWTVARGIEQLADAFRTYGMTREDFSGSRFMRVRHIHALRQEGRVNGTLRWQRDTAGRTEPERAWQPAKVGQL